MKQTITVYDFEHAFKNMDRGEQFSYKGLRALFEHLEALEEDTGDEIELDVVALCCDYSEYPSATEAAQEHGEFEEPEREEDQDDDDYKAACEDAAKEWLNDQTTVIDVEGGAVIVAVF